VKKIIMELSAIRKTLSEVAALLDAGNASYAAEITYKALSGSDEEFEQFLTSSELWGGSGSIADEALIGDIERRKKLEMLLINLGRLQIEEGNTNPRTETWVSTFEHWKQAGLR
jgi:hypothetical protein